MNRAGSKLEAVRPCQSSEFEKEAGKISIVRECAREGSATSDERRDIADVTEGARLRAVAKDRQFLAAHEHRKAAAE